MFHQTNKKSLCVAFRVLFPRLMFFVALTALIIPFERSIRAQDFSSVSTPKDESRKDDSGQPSTNVLPSASFRLQKQVESKTAQIVPLALTARLGGETSLTPNGFGSKVSVDGDYAIVGSPEKTIGNNSRQGEAYIYARIQGEWQQQQRLIDPNGKAGDTFGRSVAIDGDTAVVCFSNFGGWEAAAYVYVRNGANWVQQVRLTASNNDIISNALVAISGNTVVIGSSNNSIFVFVRNGDTWSQQAKLTSNDAQPYDYFGSSISIRGDTLFVGAYGDDPTPVNESWGSVYVFTRNGTTWTQSTKILQPHGSAYSQFGLYVALDGDTAVIYAASATDLPNNPRGVVYIFVRNETNWSLQQVIASPPGLGLGPIAISEDTVVFSAGTTYDSPVERQEFVFIYKRNGTMWSQTTQISSPVIDKNQNFGSAVAIKGSTLIVGANGYAVNGYSRSGNAYIFGNAESPAPDLQDASDTGASNRDNITNSRNPVFSINEITIGANVELIRDGVTVGSTTASGNTVTLIDGSAPANGVFQYKVRQTLTDNTVLRSGAVLVNFDSVAPTVTLNLGNGQLNATRESSVVFAVTFSEPLTNFDQSDILLSESTANISQVSFEINTRDQIFYSVLVNGIVSDGQYVRASIPAGAVTDIAGNSNSASTTTGNTVTVDNIRPTMTINQAVNQADPTTTLPINYKVVFSEPVTGFDGSDISLSGSTANVTGASITITGSGTTYNAAVSGVSSNGGFVKASIDIRYAVNDAFGNGNEPSTSTDNIVTLDNVGPSVTINQAVEQADPATYLPINFKVVFSEPVTGFDAGDISLTGSTANVSQANIEVNGSGTTYTVAVSNVTTAGFIRAGVVSGAVSDAVRNPSTSSTSTDNLVRYSPVFVTVSGQVTSANGRSAANAQLTLTLPSGELRYARTNSFGYYRFLNIQTSNISINVKSKGSIGLSRTFFLEGNYPNLNLTIP